MKIIVAGSRSFANYQLLSDTLDQVTIKLDKVVVVSGGAKGADKLAERWSFENMHDREIYYADWAKYDKAAGHIRNQEMVDKSGAKAVVVFWDGKSPGTKGLIAYARKKGLKVKVVRF